jgi:HAE1 family hydrophobic/amphiphilic exporter-1
VEKIIREEVPEAINIQSDFGTSSGFGAVFGSSSTNKGSITISLPDVKNRNRSVTDIEQVLRKRFDRIPGANITISEGDMSFGSGSDIEIKIFGYDRNVAIALADQVAEKIKDINGVVDVEKSFSKPKPEYQIRLDRDRISALGLSVYQVSSTIETDIKGKVATQFRQGGQEYEVLVQLDENARQSKTDLENLYITSPTGATNSNQEYCHNRAWSGCREHYPRRSTTTSSCKLLGQWPGFTECYPRY